MPTYEYACKACDHNFEIVQSFSEDSLTTCPECEQDELRKVYNAAGIIFKGDGWHVKDYAAAKPPSAPSTDGGTTAEGASAPAGGDKKTTKKSSTDKQAGSSSGSATRSAAS